MKQFFSLLLLLAIAAGPANAQSRPKYKVKRVFSHTSESSQGKNSKARFRKENRGATVIDFHPHDQATFKTAKANHHYKFGKGKK